MTTKVPDREFPSVASINSLECFTADRYLNKVDEIVRVTRCCIDPNDTNLVIIDFALLGAFLFVPYCKILRVDEDSYEQLRPASIDDVGGMMALLEPLEEKGVLVRRSRELLENEIERFILVERDGAIVACAALYPFEEEQSGELACLAVSPAYRGSNRGERLLKGIEQAARKQGLSTLFLLTTRTAHWFIERGFIAGSVSHLPVKKQALYNYQRNSKIFIKHLT